LEYLLLLLGFVLLLFGGKFLVNGSVSIANHFRISKLVIGVTVVSFGTSAPELFVSSLASYTGHPEVALGNVIGSNIANIALVLALTAIIFPIPVRKNSVKLDAPFMLLISGLLYVFMLVNSNLSRFEGFVFILLLIGYNVFIIYKSRAEDNIETTIGDGHLSVQKSVVIVLIATVGLAAGSHLLVENASKIAQSLGVSERVIAISLIAFGTSLPELATSAIAALKKEMDISIGNIIGSNIFNILAVLGVSSLIKPMKVSEKFIRVDIFWMMAISLLLFIFILPFKGGRLSRLKGALLFFIYGIYLFFLIKQ